jgi:hypothetical protein
MPIRVQINHFEAERVSHREAMKLVQEVVREVRTGAFRILLTGPYTTEKLAFGLETEIQVLPGAVRGKVGINGHRFPYAAAVEGGAAPHIIRPHPPRRYMKFYWRKVGDVVFFEKVHHPGQRGKGYLRIPLEKAALRHGMRLIIKV